MIRFWRFAAVLILMAFLAACSEGPAPEKGPGSDDPSGITEFPFMGVAELNQFLADNSGKPTMVPLLQAGDPGDGKIEKFAW